MKAQDLWTGYEYAYMEARPKGIETPIGATKVRVLRTIRERVDYTSERLSTFAEVEYLDGYRAGTKGKVRARDIIDFWEDYYIREEEILEERRKKERESQERMAKVGSENEKIVNGMFTRGLKVDRIFGDIIYIQRSEALAWLGLDVDDLHKEATRSETPRRF